MIVFYYVDILLMLYIYVIAQFTSYTNIDNSVIGGYFKQVK